MAGVLFIVNVPNEELEKTLSFKYRKKLNGTTITDSLQAEGTDQLLVDAGNVSNGKAIRNPSNAGTNGKAPGFASEKSPECKIDLDGGVGGAKSNSVANGGTADQTRNGARNSWEKLQNNDLKPSSIGVPVGSKDEKRVEAGVEDAEDTQDLLDLHEEFHEQETMVKTLEDILKRLNIAHASWSEKTDSYIQVTFLLESSRCEKTLAILYEYGIGQRYKSIVSVVPCSVFYEGTEHPDKGEDLEGEHQEEDTKKEPAKDTAWNRFVSSVRARLTVAQVVEGVKASATLTFDYVALLTVAAFVCAIGLVENSNVYLVSSMLISPLMGPVLAATFGTVIQDRNLQKIGVSSLLLGIGASILVGFLYGIIICLGSDRQGEGWPTREMISRGELKTLWVGGIVALLSGAAVALGILGDNIASLVGVAISTSLLPPAVNAGLFWSMAMIYGMSPESTKSSVNPTGIYSEESSWEFCALGGVSLCLTLVNVACIYIAGIMVFKVKEVAPISRGTARRFWKHDIKIARDYNKTLQNEDARNMRKMLSNEVAGMTKSDSRDSLEHQLTEHFRRSSEFNEFRSPSLRSTQYTWSPSTRGHQHTSMRDLEDLYLTLVQEKPPAAPTHRNMSFFVPNRGRRSLFEDCDDNGLPPIPEIPGSSPGIRSRLMSHNTPPSRITSTLFGTKKFIVTPAASDPLLEDRK